MNENLPEGWEELPLGKIAKAQYGVSTASAKDGAVAMLGMKNLENGRLLFRAVSRVHLSKEEVERYRLKRGDILFNRTNSLDMVGKTSIVDRVPEDDFVFASYLVRLVVDPAKVRPEYLCFFLNSDRSVRLLKTMATPGVSQYNINPTSLCRHFCVRFPVSLEEQHRITECLQVWDNAIHDHDELLAAKLRLKQALTLQLLTGKLRSGGVGTSLVPTPLSKVFQKLNDPITLEPETNYREIGIRSHGKGIFHKEPVRGRDLGDKRVYRVEPGCLTLNIVFAWERALAVTTGAEQGMIASHRFPMFRPDTSRVSAEYVRQYLLSRKGHEALQLASPGGAGRNRTLSQTIFLKTVIPLPSLREQQRVVEFLRTCDNGIALLQSQLEALKKQKSALMQKLLTGQVRMKVST